MKFHSNIIIRTPVFPFDKILNENLFNEALYLSSPDLYYDAIKYYNGILNDKKSIERLKNSIYKYKTRSFSRCTPFGLLAGVDVCQWGDKSLIVQNENDLSRKSRLDMNVVCSIAFEITKIPFIRKHLKFFPNNSIYFIGDFIRYVEYYYSNNIRVHNISKVDNSEYLNNILVKSRNGATLEEISLFLQYDEIDKETADTFINEIVESQLMKSELEPNLSGVEFFENILVTIKKIYEVSNEKTEVNEILELLTSIKEGVNNLDKTINNSVPSYLSILDKIKLILPTIQEKNLVQCDVYKVSENNTLENSIQEKLFSAIKFLDNITPNYTNNSLEDFKKRFLERYDGKSMPLLNVLDIENGIGYPKKEINGINDLINDIYISNDNSNQTLKWNPSQNILSTILNYANSKNLFEIDLTDADFENLNFENNNLPYSMSIIFKVLNNDCTKIQLQGVSDISACNILGRFTNGSEKIFQTVKEIALHEKQMYGNKILAEIIHAPERRIGNVLIREVFRDYEIPYLAKSNLDTENQIQLDDLFIKVENNKIILFSKKLKTEIIPRLGTSHNFRHNSLPVYHFLADLQIQYFKKPYIGFNWGILSSTFKFLPRATYKGVILKPATWQLAKKDFKQLLNEKVDVSELFYDLVKKWNLPKKFMILDGDHELLINTDIQTAIDVFVDCLKNKNSLTIEEFIFDEQNPLIKDSNGNGYTNEFVGIILNENNKLQNTDIIEVPINSVNNNFILGSEWLYYKIYSGVKTADYILTDKIKYITENLLNKKIIDKWFFIRYGDPDVHLRFRLHISNFEKYGEVLQLINSEFEPLLNQHIISKIQTDTYKRELERFGDNSIELVEDLFYTDSVFVSNMLDLLDADNGNTLRWQIAIRSVDEFLNDFKLTIEQKYNLIAGFSASFFIEHGGKKELKLTLDSKFRKLRAQVEDVLNYNNDDEKDYYPILKLINNRSMANNKNIETILLLNENNQLQLTLNDLLGILLHMNLDRIFMGRNRTNEFVVYDLLSRYYKSSLAKLKKNTKNDTTINL